MEGKRYTIRMNRADSGMSWGFRLHGGAEYGLPLTILKIVRNSVCDRCGLRPRDRVLSINGMLVDRATHEQTKMEIIRSGLEMDIVVFRDPSATPPQTIPPPSRAPEKAPEPKKGSTAYAPVVAPGPKMETTAPTPSEPPKSESAAPAPSQTAEQNTPAASEPEPASNGTISIAPLTIQTDIDIPPDNEVLSPRDVLASPAFREQNVRGSKPFSPGGSKKAVPNVTHAQYNSPMGLYSADNIAQVYAAQTAGIEREMENVDVSRAQVGTKMTGTLQVLGTEWKSPSSYRDYWLLSLSVFLSIMGVLSY